LPPDPHPRWGAGVVVCLLIQTAAAGLGAVGGVVYAGDLPTEWILTAYPVLGVLAASLVTVPALLVTGALLRRRERDSGFGRGMFRAATVSAIPLGIALACGAGVVVAILLH
jgi:hypothetical protein